jgi:hypothetical protein
VYPFRAGLGVGGALRPHRNHFQVLREPVVTFMSHSLEAEAS